MVRDRPLRLIPLFDTSGDIISTFKDFVACMISMSDSLYSKEKFHAS
jgi:hypothetical protein